MDLGAKTVSDFMRSNSKIEQAVIDATTGQDAGYEHMRSALRNALQADGVIVRDRYSEFGVHVVRPSETPKVAALPANPAMDTYMRVVYPAGNNRFEIYGASEAELDAKEA